jgi:putative solute:sodium symporter small subunit
MIEVAMITEPKPDVRPYWHAHMRILAILLGVWALVSFGLSIVFADQLDRIRVGGFKLGFWFAQQGSIYIFLLLIVIYVRLMNRLDRRYQVDERERL